MKTLPNLESLRCFLAGAKTLNFRAAARTVHLTPAAFGQRIQQLEDLLDERLFKRTTRNMSLTEAGMKLIPRAEKTLEVAAACHGISSKTPLPRTDIVIGTRFELGLSWLMPALPKIEQQLGQSKCHLHFGSGHELLAAVKSRQIDCAITSTAFVDPALNEIHIHDEKYMLVASSKLNASTRSWKSLTKTCLLDISPAFPLFRYLSAVKPELRPRHFSEHRFYGTLAAIRHFVLKGQGVAVLPAYFVEKDIAAKKISRLFPKTILNQDAFRLILRSDDARTSLFDALGRHLRTLPLK